MNKAVVGQEEARRRVNIKLTRELGPLVCGLLEDPSVIEIMLNPDGELWVERLGKDMEPCGRMTESSARSLMNTIASTLNEELTEENPFLECELPLDGSRFTAVVPPIVEGPTFCIRKRAIKVFTLKDYVEEGIMTATQSAVIEDAVINQKNILIVGGTGSGKTTLTNAVINHIVDVCPNDRLLVMEDTRELQIPARNKVGMKSFEYADMTIILKLMMRLRPDRIVVGEVRDGAVLALLKAWNTDHPGGAATLHANSAYETFSRIELLLKEVIVGEIPSAIAAALGLIVYIEKHGGSRKVSEILRVDGYDGQKYLTQSVGA